MTLETDRNDDHPQGETLSPPQRQESPAITVVIQSWTTPIAAIVMLIVGLLGGYFGRPFLSSETIPAAAEEDSATVVANAPIITVPTPNTELATQQQELMAAVVENTRHFRGNPAAPVTLIEFSDFQ